MSRPTPSSPERRCFLGLDPGVARTGYGVVERRGGQSRCLAYGCLTTPQTLPLPDRLHALFVATRELIAAYRPAAVAVETLLFGKNVKTGMAVGAARGVILLAIAEARRPLVELTPPQVKQALTAYGRADKRQVQQMVRRVLQLKVLPRPDDAADALAVALAAEQMYAAAQQR
jgi:crossover junction endodeoxyribonuclease RuvC